MNNNSNFTLHEQFIIIEELLKSLHNLFMQCDRKHDAPFIFRIRIQITLLFIHGSSRSSINRFSPPEIQFVKRQPNSIRYSDIRAVQIRLRTDYAMDVRKIQLQVAERRPHVLVVHSRNRLVDFLHRESQRLRLEFAAPSECAGVEDPVGNASRREGRPELPPPVNGSCSFVS